MITPPPRLSKADLRRLARIAPAGAAPALRAYDIGLRIIAGFLGRPWLDRRLAEPAGFLERPAVGAADTRATRHVLQVIDLAEMLLNLQFVGGFEHCLKGLDAPDITAGLAGLEIGRLIHACQMEFSYLGEPCALRLKLADARWVAATAHAHIPEGAAASAELVREIFAAGAARVVGDGPAFVFLQFPISWGADRLGLLDEGAARFLAEADERVVSVKAYASAHGGAARDLTFAIKEYDNEAAAFQRAGGWTVFARPRNVRWRYLRGL